MSLHQIATKVVTTTVTLCALVSIPSKNAYSNEADTKKQSTACSKCSPFVAVAKNCMPCVIFIKNDFLFVLYCTLHSHLFKE